MTQVSHAPTAAPSSARETPGRTRHRRSRLGRRKSVANLCFAAPAVIFLLLLSLYPMFILLQMSVSRVTIRNLLGYWPIVGAQNYRQVLTQSTFHAVALQTLLFVLGILVATVVLGFLIAMILRPNTRFTQATQTSLILVWTLPPVIIGSLWKFVLASDGSINDLLVKAGLLGKAVPFLSESKTSLGSVALVSLWVGLPFAALVIKSAVLDISEEIMDAARIDGASSWQVVKSIIVPMIKPTLLILAVLSVVGAFKGFDFIYVMTSGGPGTSSSTIPFLGYLTAFQSYQFGTAAAISVLAMAIVLVLAVAYILAIRHEER